MILFVIILLFQQVCLKTVMVTNIQESSVMDNSVEKVRFFKDKYKNIFKKFF